MDAFERELLAFARLARISHERRQLGPRDKFLVLTGAAATRAGYPEVASRYRELVLHHNPAHLLKRYASFPDALRNPEFQFFEKQLARFCTYERAEHLLQGLEIADSTESAGIGPTALGLLDALAVDEE